MAAVTLHHFSGLAAPFVRPTRTVSGGVFSIEPGVPQSIGDTYTKRDENYWDNYPSAYNKTITPDKIKQLIGRILQYGYTGQVSASWSSVNGDDLANVMATQMLIWEVIVGERDESFNKVGTGSKHAVLEVHS